MRRHRGRNGGVREKLAAGVRRLVLVAQKVAESLFAKYIRIALATFRKFDDFSGYAVAGVKTAAPVSLNSRASHFECDAHDPRGFRVKLLIAEKWCDWHDACPLAVSFLQAAKRERRKRVCRLVNLPEIRPIIRSLRCDSGPPSS